MFWRLRRAKGCMKLSLALNVVIVAYVGMHSFNYHYADAPRQLTNEFNVNNVRDTRTLLFTVPSEVVNRSGPVTPRAVQNRTHPPPTEPPKCSKRFLFFGIRQHWFEFCSFEEFSQYKHLISFPRELECPNLNCAIILTYSLEAKDIPGNDVVLFTDVYHWLTPEMWDWAHGNRTRGQRWVMITEESPLYGPGVQPPDKYANNTYDFIDSYKSDSDFVHPYGFYIPYKHRPPKVFDTEAMLANKTKTLAWMGSHCETLQWNRKLFVEDVGKIVHIDKFGKCGDTEIPWNDFGALRETLSPYKFYLSLENSCCEDYVTEKFWRTLELGLVPIVVGAPYDFYLKVAPPHSFIHPDQFDSVADMALHVVEVNANKDKYLEYFKWKNIGRLVSHGQEDHYVRPLENQTQCDILEKHISTASSEKRDFFGQEWYGSCLQCGTKPWMKRYMLDINHARGNADIWA